MSQKSKPGRKPLSAAPQHGPEFVGKTPPAMAEQEAQINRGISTLHNTEFELLQQILGQAQMANAFSQFSRTVAVSKLAHVKETKIYRALRGMPTPDASGVLSGTWEEFCSLLGRSVDQVDIDIKNLRTFGEEALESMSRMGIGYRDFRRFRALPEDGKTALIEVAKKGDKEALLELAEDLIAKQEAEKKKLADELDKAKNQYEARETVIANNQKKIAELKEKLARIPKEKPDEKGKAMILEIAATAIGASGEVKQLVKGIEMLLQHAHDSGIEDAEYRKAIEHHVSGLIADIGDLISLFEVSGMTAIPDRLRAAIGD